jgi:hypothetical protein
MIEGQDTVHAFSLRSNPIHLAGIGSWALSTPLHQEYLRLSLADGEDQDVRLVMFCNLALPAMTVGS